MCVETPLLILIFDLHRVFSHCPTYRCISTYEVEYSKQEAGPFQLVNHDATIVTTLVVSPDPKPGRHYVCNILIVHVFF